MSAAPDERSERPEPYRRALAFWIAGFMLAGCLGGLAVRQLVLRAGTSPETRAVGTEEAPESREATGPAFNAPAFARPVARMRTADVAPPADPFQPTKADPVPAPAIPNPLSGDGLLPSSPFPLRIVPSPSTLPAPLPQSQAEAVPFPGSLAVVGVVHGDPPLAVVRLGEQTFYLKIGDRTADSWRLEAINERSALFQLGAQRVEVPIQGGSPE